MDNIIINCNKDFVISKDDITYVRENTTASNDLSEEELAIYIAKSKFIAKLQDMLDDPDDNMTWTIKEVV